MALRLYESLGFEPAGRYEKWGRGRRRCRRASNNVGGAGRNRD